MDCRRSTSPTPAETDGQVSEPLESGSRPPPNNVRRPSIEKCSAFVLFSEGGAGVAGDGGQTLGEASPQLQDSTWSAVSAYMHRSRALDSKLQAGPEMQHAVGLTSS